LEWDGVVSYSFSSRISTDILYWRLTKVWQREPCIVPTVLCIYEGL
jgi:hypothetical protein